jgi:hypothetical protein
MTASTVFPIGHYAGTRPVATAPVPNGSRTGTAGASHHLVRIGRGLEHLTDDEFGVWVLAHGLADSAARGWTREDILDRAMDAQITAGDVCLDQLLDRGLLVQVPTDVDHVDAAVEFATTYRMGTLLVGLGPVPDRPDQHAVGVPGIGTAALLDAGAFRLWQWGGVAPTLWRHCHDRVRTGGRGGLDTLVDPATVLFDVLADLRTLIVHGCAYLDLATPTDGTALTADGDTAATPTETPTVQAPAELSRAAAGG